MKSKLKIKNMGKKCKLFSFNSANLIFNIIKTNRKSTAIAPTYIIRNNKGRYSTSNKNKRHEISQKHRIKKSIEKIGFFEITTITLEIIPKTLNK
tara:strand:+ start:12126 stop:12410 length:285 start_codon:yes stop_codon:yes gene_type:complete